MKTVVSEVQKYVPADYLHPNGWSVPAISLLLTTQASLSKIHVVLTFMLTLHLCKDQTISSVINLTVGSYSRWT